MRHWGKTLTTLHSRLDLPDLPPMLREFAMMPLVSISNAQRMPVPWANWHGTVYHGLPSNLYAGGCGDGGYLAYAQSSGVSALIKPACSVLANCSPTIGSDWQS